MQNRPWLRSDQFSALLIFSSLSMTAMANGMETITVSESGGVGFDQTHPRVIGTSEGAIIAFRDGRGGLMEDRLRALDHSGVPRGPSAQLANSAFPMHETYDLELGANAAGDVVAVWGVVGTGGRHAVHIDSTTAQPLGDETVILGDEPGVNFDSEVTIEVAADGSILVFFMAETEFRARLYSRNFDALGPSFLVESDTGGNYVDTSFHANGEFTLAWTGVEVPYFSMVRSRRFGADGTAIGPSFDLTSDADGVFIDTPAIAGRPDGTAMVAWLKWSGGAGIWGQLLDETGVPDGSPSLLVDPDEVLGDPRDLFAKADGSWALVQHLDSDVDAASIEIFGADMTPTGSEAVVVATYQSEAAWLAESESILLVWETISANPNIDVSGALVNTHRTSAGSSAILSDESDGADQVSVVVDGNEQGRSVFAWVDHRNGRSEIYMQIYDEVGDPVGGNMPIAEVADQLGTPNGVSMNAAGEILVGWQDVVEGEAVLVAQRHGADGRPLGGPINMSSGGPEPYGAFILSLLDDGSFLAAWNSMTQLPSPGLFEIDMNVRMFGPEGTPRTSTAMALNEVHWEIRDYRPIEIVKRSDGGANVFCAFQSWDSNGVSIQAHGAMFRSVSPGGIPDGQEFVFLDSDPPLDEITVAGDSTGFVVAWTESASEVVHVRHFNSESVEVAQDTINGVVDACNPVALIGSDRTRYVGFDYRSMLRGIPQHEFNFKRYDNFGIPLGEPVNVFMGGAELDYAWYDPGPDAVIAGSRFIYGYSSASGTDQGYDVRMSWNEVESFQSGDYNCDNRVDGLDLSRLLGFWGLSLTDLTGDGTTDGLDLAIVLGNWTG